MEDGNYLALHADEASTFSEIRRHSKRDADLLSEFQNMMYKMAFAVKPILGMIPPDLAMPGMDGLRTLRDLGKHMQSLGKKDFHWLTKIMTMSAYDFVKRVV